jgi:hypothetical protein
MAGAKTALALHVANRGGRRRRFLEMRSNSAIATRSIRLLGKASPRTIAAQAEPRNNLSLGLEFISSAAPASVTCVR